MINCVTFLSINAMEEKTSCFSLWRMKIIDGDCRIMTPGVEIRAFVRRECGTQKLKSTFYKGFRELISRIRASSCFLPLSLHAKAEHSEDIGKQIWLFVLLDFHSRHFYSFENTQREITKRNQNSLNDQLVNFHKNWISHRSFPRIFRNLFFLRVYNVNFFEDTHDSIVGIIRAIRSGKYFW